MTINGCNYNESALRCPARPPAQLLRNAAAEPAPGQGRSAAPATRSSPPAGAGGDAGGAAHLRVSETNGKDKEYWFC